MRAWLHLLWRIRSKGRNTCGRCCPRGCGMGRIRSRCRWWAPRAGAIASMSLDMLLLLARAVRGRVAVRYDCLPRSGGEAQPRWIAPDHLVESESRWYLLGRDLERHE